jgi:hypothetical protein
MEVPLISVHLAIGVCNEKGAGLAGIGSVNKGASASGRGLESKHVVKR